MASQRRSDFGAALTGLVVGSCVLFVMVFGVMKWTDSLFAGKTHGAQTK